MKVLRSFRVGGAVLTPTVTSTKAEWLASTLLPGFNAWLDKPCSQCGRIHPSACYIGRDPDYQSLIAGVLEQRKRAN